jgi:hypothetical protein
VALEAELQTRDRDESTAKWLTENYEDIALKVPEIEEMSYEETINQLSTGQLKIFNEAELMQEQEQKE